MTHKIFRVDCNGQDVEKLSAELVKRFSDIDISWLSDGSAVISVDATLTEIKTELVKQKLTPMSQRPDIKHRVDENGKEAVNFNISFGLYIFILGASFIPFFFNSFHNLFNNIEHSDFGIDIGSGIFSLFGIASIVSIVTLIKIALIIIAAMKANKGEVYKYPFTINFIK